MNCTLWSLEGTCLSSLASTCIHLSTTGLAFCNSFHLRPLPASEQQLILFTADLSQRLSFASVRSYLSAVRFLHISQGFRDPMVGKLQLDLLLRGVRRWKPGLKDKRLPVTPLILEKVYSSLNRYPGRYENKLLWAACCLGFSPLRGIHHRIRQL